MTTKLPPGAFNAPHVADSAHAVADQPPRKPWQPAPKPWPPIAQLRYVDNDTPALLLLSLYFTHRHAFDYLGFRIEQYTEPQVITGEFVQRETGRHYQVRVSSQGGDKPADIRPPVQVPASWLDLFGEALACLRQAEPYVRAVCARDPQLQQLAERIAHFTQESPES